MNQITNRVKFRLFSWQVKSYSFNILFLFNNFVLQPNDMHLILQVIYYIARVDHKLYQL